MFLCEPCLEKNFKNWFFPNSVGKCEYCLKTATCTDIPSKFLVDKEKTKEENK